MGIFESSLREFITSSGTILLISCLVSFLISATLALLNLSFKSGSKPDFPVRPLLANGGLVTPGEGEWPNIPIPPLIKLIESGEDEEGRHTALPIRKRFRYFTDQSGKLWYKQKMDILTPWTCMGNSLQHHQIRNLLELHHPSWKYPLTHYNRVGRPAIRTYYLLFSVDYDTLVENPAEVRINQLRRNRDITILGLRRLADPALLNHCDLKDFRFCTCCTSPEFKTK